MKNKKQSVESLYNKASSAMDSFELQIEGIARSIIQSMLSVISDHSNYDNTLSPEQIEVGINEVKSYLPKIDNEFVQKDNKFYHSILSLFYFKRVEFRNVHDIPDENNNLELIKNTLGLAGFNEDAKKELEQLFCLWDDISLSNHFTLNKTHRSNRDKFPQRQIIGDPTRKDYRTKGLSKEAWESFCNN